jgi:GH15 family glucan-1,4-alpha-glucosidase
MSGAADEPRGDYLPISDYALLSDCHSTALVSRHGSIDWACLRTFDSGSTFARLLDFDGGGFWSITPTDELVAVTRRYLPATMVVETTMTTASGTVVLTDAFAMAEGGATAPSHELLRSLECTHGDVAVSVAIAPRFDYGNATPWMRAHGDGVHSAVAGDDALVVAASGIELQVDRRSCMLTGETSLTAGQHLALVAVAQPAAELDPSAASIDVRRRMDQTIDWWTTWSKQTTVDGPHAELLARSALVLKSLCSASTGSIIAAPTTSLPEIIGGASNWDYRACWIRDATLTLDALSQVGHHEVADGFRRFIMRTAAGDASELQIMYGPRGQRRLQESELDLHGWRGSRPVRIGNAAATQVQLDVYGHLVDAVHLWHEQHQDLDRDEWKFIASVIECAIDRWEEPDAGIWELRGPPRHYVHSKVMVWVALDRGIRLVRDHGLDHVDVARWERVRETIRETVDAHGVHRDGHYVQDFDSDTVDASLLKLPLVGYIDASDPRMIRTVEAIQRDLTAPNGFLRRHHMTGDHHDGRREGVFLLCSCWLVEVLVLQGRTDEAGELFERLVGLGNDLALFAEEQSVDSDEMLGNFPQAFTHLGLIAADRRLRAATGHNTSIHGTKQSSSHSEYRPARTD